MDSGHSANLIANFVHKTPARADRHASMPCGAVGVFRAETELLDHKLSYNGLPSVFVGGSAVEYQPNLAPPRDARPRLTRPERRRLVQDSGSVSIIDDDASLRVALTKYLLFFGYAASGFGSVEEFLLASEYLSSACVVTDIYLPGRSGIDLLLRLGIARPDLPVIVMTARSEPALLASARSGGASCLLQKPFAGDTLVRSIEAALDARASPH
jgi:CheY-like chemotaxis protein